MSEFPAVVARDFGSGEVQSVDARELHRALGVKRDFSSWVKGRIEELGFVRGAEWETFLGATPPNGGTARIEYVLSLDMAKHLAMIERTEIGHKVREYFLACEKKALAAPVRQLDFSDPDTVLELAANWAAEKKRVLALEATLEEQKPKVLFAEVVDRSRDTITVTEAAKRIGLNPKVLFSALRGDGILYRRGKVNLPAQAHIDNGRFVVHTGTYQRGETEEPYSQARVTGKGLIWLTERYGPTSLVEGEGQS